MNWLRSISLSLVRVIYDTGTCGRATDSRLPAGQLNDWGDGGGGNWAGWSHSQTGFNWSLCGPHTNVTTLTQARCHLPHILLNKRRLRELTINTVTSFLGPPASCSKYIHIQYIFFSVVTSSPSITPVILAHFSHVCRKSPGCVLSFSPLSYFITLHFI